MCTGKCPLRTDHDVVLGLVIGHAGQHDLEAGGQVFRRLGHPRSPLSHLLGLLPGTVIHGQLVTRVEQPVGHLTDPVPHADKSNTWFQMVAFHIHCNTFLSSEMLRYDPPRHPAENLLSYKDEVEGNLKSLAIAPDPLKQREVHLTAMSVPGIPGEVSVHRMADHFPSLPILLFRLFLSQLAYWQQRLILAALSQRITLPRRAW